MQRGFCALCFFLWVAGRKGVGGAGVCVCVSKTGSIWKLLVGYFIRESYASSQL